MGHSTTRPSARLRPSCARRVILTVLAARLAVGPAAAHTGPAQVERVIDGRLLRYVMLPGGEHVNATLIREGYATVIRTFPDARRRECLQLEAQARRARRGRWAN